MLVYIDMLFLFFFGLILGSFLSAFSYRFPRDISFVWGRSFCPVCKGKIFWYDNIPLLSFFLLGGRCRNCKKKISWRYPLIELTTGVFFVLIYSFYLSCLGQDLYFSSTIFCSQVSKMGFLSLPYWFLIFSLLFVVFIIDFEHKIIFDGITYLVFTIFIVNSLFLSDVNFYINLFLAFSFSSFLLLLYFLTLGKGMGFGDVKLALPLGFYLGFPLGLVWFFLSFLTGSIIGIILILVGKAKFGKPIPFGPFMIFSFWLTLFFGERLILFFR